MQGWANAALGTSKMSSSVRPRHSASARCCAAAARPSAALHCRGRSAHRSPSSVFRKRIVSWRLRAPRGHPSKQGREMAIALHSLIARSSTAVERKALDKLYPVVWPAQGRAATCAPRDGRRKVDSRRVRSGLPSPAKCKPTGTVFGKGGVGLCLASRGLAFGRLDLGTRVNKLVSYRY